jgi:hypothetical protein
MAHPVARPKAGRDDGGAMQIVLHLGAHRTATTTLQQTLGESHIALQGAGLAYWGPKRLRAGLFDGLYEGGPVLPPRRRGRAQGRVALQLRQAADGGAKTLLVSDENMLGTMRQIMQAQRLYPGAGERVARFAEAFAPHQVTLGLSIRCYDAFWASALGWRMRRGGPLPLPSLCDRLVTQPRRWRHVIADLAQAVPEARIAVWTHEAMAGRPVDLIAALTGARVALKGAERWCNPGARLSDLRAYLDDIGADPALARGTAGRFMPFDPDQRTALRAQYAEDLSWLAQGAGGLASHIDEAGAMTLRPTGQGRGPRDDRDHAWRLAQPG